MKLSDVIIQTNTKGSITECNRWKKGIKFWTGEVYVSYRRRKNCYVRVCRLEAAVVGKRIAVWPVETCKQRCGQSYNGELKYLFLRKCAVMCVFRISYCQSSIDVLSVVFLCTMKAPDLHMSAYSSPFPDRMRMMMWKATKPNHCYVALFFLFCSIV